MNPRSGSQMRWVEEEDEILRSCVEQYTEPGSATDWSRVAEKLTRRTNKDCRKRWINHVCGGLKKGPWEADEDMCLREAVAQYGQKWTMVASMISSRSADQCAKRWRHKLDPRLDRQRWTPKEDELLLESVNHYGREWRKIQEKHYGTRSANDLKNRFTILSKKNASRASCSSGASPTQSYPSSSPPTVVSDQNQQGTSLSMYPGNISQLDSNASPEADTEGVYNLRDLYSGITQPTTNMQLQWEQEMRPQDQVAPLLPLVHDGQSMAVDDIDYDLANSGGSWSTGTTPTSVTGALPFTSGDFPNAMLSNGLTSISHHPYPQSQTDAGDGNMGGLAFGFDNMEPVLDSVKNGDLPSILAHKANTLGSCKPGGSVCLQTEGCDRDVVNYLLDVLLPIRCLVKIEMEM